MTDNSRLFKVFRNLKSDALPTSPSCEADRNKNDRNANSNNINSGQENRTPLFNFSRFTFKNSKDEKKSKAKNFDNIRQKSNPSQVFETTKNKDGRDNYVNTQATGNVINIVNSHDVHWGNKIVYNSQNTNLSEDNEDEVFNIEKSDSIMQLMQAKTKVEHEFMDYITKNLGKNWHSFFRSLGYTKGRIETIEIDESRNGVSEARYKLLLDWTRNDDDGSLGRLAVLLWDHGEKAIVKELAFIYKNMQQNVSKN